LRSPEFSIDEVAFLLGYANTPSFTRAFRTWTGLAPSEYRTRENDAAG
jgi:AraC-like DNA-binding protein